MPSFGEGVWVPRVVAREINVFPSQWGKMREQFVIKIGCVGSDGLHGSLQIDGVPEDDGGAQEVEATGSVALIFKGAIPDFAQSVKENGSGEGVSRFPFIESHMNAATQFGVLKPLQHKEGAFEASDFA